MVREERQEQASEKNGGGAREKRRCQRHSGRLSCYQEMSGGVSGRHVDSVARTEGARRHTRRNAAATDYASPGDSTATVVTFIARQRTPRCSRVANMREGELQGTPREASHVQPPYNRAARLRGGDNSVRHAREAESRSRIEGEKVMRRTR